MIVLWYSIFRELVDVPGICWYISGAELVRTVAYGRSMSHLIYRDIASTLRSRIARGDFRQGKLPSERELTGEFGVQRATIRRALQTLEQEGLVFRDSTRGTLAASPVSFERRLHSSSQTTGIALIMGRAADTTAPSDIARGLTRVMNASETRRSIICFDAPAAAGHVEAPAPRPADLLASGAAGAVLWPQIPSDVATLRALRAAMPLVLVDRRVPGFESDYVGIQDHAAGQTVTQHLISAGHQRIGFLGVAPLVGTVQARCRGWMTALLDGGITSRPGWTLLRQGDDLDPVLDAPALRLFLEGDAAGPLTAVVCSNDTVAAGLLCFLRAEGRRVPDDVAVTGFGNAFPQMLDALGLTTIAQPWEEIGAAAGEILLRRLAGNPPSADDYTEVELPVSLVVRSSCGAVSPRFGA